MLKKLLLLTLLQLLLFEVTIGQPINNALHFKHLGAKQGLSQTAISDIIMDHEGYIWMSTWKGLFRYDGYTMKPHFINEQDANGIRSDYLNTLHEDQYDQLWVGSMGGLYLYDRDKGYFDCIKITTDRPYDKVLKIASSKDGNLWVCTRTGLYLFDPLRKTAIKKIFNDKVTTILEDNDFLWVGTDNGIKVLDLNGKEKKGILPENTPESLKTTAIIALYKDKNETVWISSWELFAYQPKTQKVTLFKQEVWDFYEFGEQLWMASTTGIYVLDDTFKLNKIEKIVSNGKNISNNFFTSLYKDKQGNLWIGGFRKGAYLYNVLNSKFNLISSNQGGFEILGHNSVMDIYEENGLLWFATDGGGITLFDLKENNKVKNKEISLFNNKSILSIRKEKYLDKYWVTTWGEGIYITDLKSENKQIIKNNQAPMGLPENNIWFTYEDSKGNIWASVHEKGLCLLDKSGKVKEKFIPAYKDTPFLSTFSIFEDSQSRLYLCTTQGLVVINLEDFSKRYFMQDIHQLHPLPGYSVNCAFEDSKGRIWVGTNNGLALFDPIKGHFFRKGGDLGTLGPRVQAIEEDKEGNLWLAVNNQIVKYSLHKDVLSVYTPDDMAFDGEFNIGASLRLEDGRLLFGSTNGIVMFNPTDLNFSAYQPPLKIVSLELYNQEVNPFTLHSPLQKVIDRTDTLTLSYRQDVFSLIFSTLNYSQNNQNKYKYILEGFDKEWQEVGNKRSTTYTNLNPGTYTFKVKVSNNDGKWQESKALVIEQLPPFWLTWWAKCIYTVLFLIVIYYIYRFLIYREKLKSQVEIAQLNRQKEKEIISIREQFFTNISHELRTPLTLILTPLETLMSSKENEKNNEIYQLMNSNAHRLLRLINQLMDFRKAESGLLQLNIQRGNIFRAVNKIAQLYVFKAQHEGIVYEWETFPEDLWVEYDQDKLEKILHNLLSNAFKHTPAEGKILLKAFIVNKNEKDVEIRIEVKDTGLGISKEHQKEIFNRYYVVRNDPGKGTGIGLTLTKDLVELQDGTIGVESEIGNGATFYINLSFGLANASLLEEVDRIESNAISIDLSEEIGDKNEDASKPKVLIIDDNPEIQSYLKLELKEHYNVITANDGVQGFKKAVDELPELIISDVMMPKMNGIEMCDQLKSNLETSHIPLLMLTAKHSEKAQLEGLNHGADEYFIKPFNTSILKSRVAYHIKLRKDLRLKFKTKAFIKPKEITTSNSDQEFLDKVYEVVFDNIENNEFNTVVLCEKMGVSKTLLYNKLKTLTGCSTAEFIKSARMTTAAKLLLKDDLQVKEVAYSCGFLNQQQFYNTFTKFHGMSPSKYKEQHLGTTSE